MYIWMNQIIREYEFYANEFYFTLKYFYAEDWFLTTIYLIFLYD